MRRAFTLIEVLLVAAILVALAGTAVPLYRRYQIRNDLSVASEQIIQALGRAQLLSQTGWHDGEWGFHVPSGTLYQGMSYAARNQTFDESYPVPTTISTAGLSELIFSRVDGRPSATGSIVLTTITGEQRTIDISINTQGIATDVTDKVTICHKPNTSACKTMKIKDKKWFSNGGHKKHGDALGPCQNCANPPDEDDDDD